MTTHRPDSDLQSLERFVAENDDLLHLEEQIGRFNIFDALGIARVEIRHSNYLAWLLTPNESHGQGDLFLKAVLMDVLRKAREQGVQPPVSPVELDGADLQRVDIRREWRNIDILINGSGPQFVVAIENKIGSGEHGNQLQRYEDTIAKEFPGIKCLFVYLTPDGDSASNERWVAYSYAHLHATLTRVRKANTGAIGGDVAVFLDHYLSLIGSRFMENAELDRLCRQIYSNHRQALDLIWERVGSPSSGLVGRIEQWIKEESTDCIHIGSGQNCVRFIASTWDKMLPPIGKHGAYAADQWLIARFEVQNTRLRLIVELCPTTDPLMRSRVLERITRDKREFGFSTFFKKKELITQGWTRVLSEEVCPLSEDEDPDIDAVMQCVEKRLEELRRQTARLPDALRELALSTGYELVNTKTS